MSNYKTRKLGAIPSPKDHRDIHIASMISIRQTFPAEFTIEPRITEPYDQGEVGACVAFALKATKEIQEHKEHGTFSALSAAYIYGARLENHYHGEGMITREALELLLKRGVCREEMLPGIYPYPVAAGMITEAMHQDAYPRRISSYAAVYTVNEVKSALMELGPVVMVVPVYESFYQGGHLPQPDTLTENMYGFHALTIIGWKRDHRWLGFNSWGKKWGALNGYCTLPFNYPITEIWTVTDLIEKPEKDIYKLFVQPLKKGLQRRWLVHLGSFPSQQEALNQVARPLQQDLQKIGKPCKIQI